VDRKPTAPAASRLENSAYRDTVSGHGGAMRWTRVSNIGASISANHRRYVAMDACLQRTPRAIRTDFFAAAACVTHPVGGLGVLDGVLGRLVFTPEQSAFLRFVHGSLATVNRSWFARLLHGAEISGCEGKRGPALDHALVDLEQAAFTRAMSDFFGSDDMRRERLMVGINATFHQNPLFRCPLLEMRLRAALAAVRSRCRFDLGDEAQRRSVGHALVDLVRSGRERPGRSSKQFARPLQVAGWTEFPVAAAASGMATPATVFGEGGAEPTLWNRICLGR
jgi:hypothetical protein